MSKVLGIIPARGGSKGIPNKNIRLLNGVPLITYTIQKALNSKILDRVIVSTDSPEIASVAEKSGAEVPFIRPTELATDTARSVDVVLHALEFYEKERVEQYDAVCLLQPTSPYRPGNVIDEALETFLEGGYDALVSVRKVPDHYHPNWVFRLDNGKLSNYTNEPIETRRQNLNPCYHRDGAIYITRTAVIEKEQSFLASNTCGFVINSPALINIDSMDDWRIAEQYLIDN